EIYGDDEGGVSRFSGQGDARSLTRQQSEYSAMPTLSKMRPQANPLEAPGPESTHAGPPMRLEVIEGPDEGEHRRFKGVRMLVGRVKGCDLLLNDPSVSRRHLEVVVGEEGALLRDLESGNGTKVNGERVVER